MTFNILKTMTTKSILLILAILLSSVYSNIANAQSNDGIAKSLGLYVFPPDGKDAAGQEADEMACFNWAKKETGVDPLNPTQVQAAKVDTSPDGTAVVGSIKGAAAGAAIGAIAGDTGKGAAIGAVAGGIRGRQAKVSHDKQQQQQANQTADAMEKEYMDNYKKAFSVCMEAKGYTVK